MAPSFDAMTPRARGIRLAEFLVGGAIVIGHNVFKVVPNEVPILVALASYRLGFGRAGGRWRVSGGRRHGRGRL